MAHPMNEHRDHLVQERRVGHITKGYASGGRVHSDEAEDKAMVKHMVKPGALKAHGGKVKHRADRPHRAHGGKVGKGKGTNVNVIIAPQGGPAMPPPGLGGLPPGVPPRPPMPAPGPAGPPMAGPGPMGPPMPPHASGGRAYATGGAVKDGPAWKEGLREGTQVQHTDGKKDGKDIGRRRVVTFMAGGAVEHKKGGMGPTGAGSGHGKHLAARKGNPIYSNDGPMGPHLDGGSGGGVAKKEMAHRAAKYYAKPGPSVNAGPRG